VTIDDDLATALQRLARESRRPFKQVLNDALRAGLLPRPTGGAESVTSPTHSLGLRAGVELGRARHLAADLEDDETVRKLELRK
jgi:hypothetical protein